MENALADARVVTLIVHGVGDHSEAKILDKVGHGLAHSAPDLRTEMREIEIPCAFKRISPFTDSDLTDRPLPIEAAALVISSGTSKHIIIPIEWGHLHTRVGWQKLGQNRDPTKVLANAFVPTVRLSVDLFRCVTKAKGAWKFLLLIFALSVPAAAFSLYFAVLYLYAQFYPYRFSGSKVVLAGLLVTFVALVLKWVVLPAVDLVGDIAYYIGSVSRRAQIEKTMTKIMEWAAESAPNASILIVGHSLGSVLVTHSIIRLSECAGFSHRILILTLGSPLRFLSRVFPLHVHTPAALADHYFKGTLVDFWGNLWRDRDIVGKELGLDNTSRFAEKSLGDGRHSNYWCDERLWESVNSIIQAAGTGNFASLSDAWRSLPLTNDEKNELEERVFYIGGKYARQLGTTLFGLAVAWPIIFGRLSHSFPADALQLGLSGAWKVYLTAIGPLFLWMLRGIQFRTNEREQLARLRNRSRTYIDVLTFWRTWFRGFMMATLVMLARELYRLI
jgi:hypothetical protein